MSILTKNALAAFANAFQVKSIDKPFPHLEIAPLTGKTRNTQVFLSNVRDVNRKALFTKWVHKNDD